MSCLIEDFFADKCIFITGATGFLGKVLLYKLLSSCPRVSTIYILIRSRNGQSSPYRLEKFLKSKVFESLHHSNPQCFQKVVPICGDITFDGLGINPNDYNTLAQNVSIVFNVAATIRFDEPLKRAVNINVKGTNRVVELCHQIKNLKALIHVSTAYCTKDKNNIKETICKESMSADNIMAASEWMDEDAFSSLSKFLFAGRPTSYHYTKSLAENLLFEKAKYLPVAIIRPSIIVAAHQDPYPGWIDNYNGPSGFLIALGKGILRTLHGDPNNISDIIPVDIVANCMIVAAFKIGQEREMKEPMIVNCTSGQLNPITWGQIQDFSIPFLIKYPTCLIFRYPSCQILSNRLLHLFFLHLEHNIPAFLTDLLFKITSHKPFLGQVFQKVNRTISALEPFTLHQWTWLNENLLTLMNCLSDHDRNNFLIDVRKVDWITFMENYVLGIRRFVLNEDISNLQKARKNLNRIYFATQFIKLAIVTGVVHQTVTRFVLPRLRKQAS